MIMQVFHLWARAVSRYCVMNETFPPVSTRHHSVGGGNSDCKKILPSGQLSLFQQLRSSDFPAARRADTTAMIRNEVFSCFVFYAVLLVVKMYVIAVITGQVRLRKKVRGTPLFCPRVAAAPSCLHWFLVYFSASFKAFANPEDALRHGGLQFHREDPYVERCRRWEGTKVTVFSAGSATYI